MRAPPPTRWSTRAPTRPGWRSGAARCAGPLVVRWPPDYERLVPAEGDENAPCRHQGRRRPRRIQVTPPPGEDGWRRWLRDHGVDWDGGETWRSGRSVGTARRPVQAPAGAQEQRRRQRPDGQGGRGQQVGGVHAGDERRRRRRGAAVAAAATAPSTATPRAPPTCRLVVITAEATPAWVPGMAATPAAVAREIDSPARPRAWSAATSRAYGVPTSMPVRAHRAAALQQPGRHRHLQLQREASRRARGGDDHGQGVGQAPQPRLEEATSPAPPGSTGC